MDSAQLTIQSTCVGAFEARLAAAEKGNCAGGNPDMVDAYTFGIGGVGGTS
jgi:hypothetical protein